MAASGVHPPDESLAGGGERWIPELDASCGVGWGTVVLANAGARSVVGIDIGEPIEPGQFRPPSTAVERELERTARQPVIERFALRVMRDRAWGHS